MNTNIIAIELSLKKLANLLVESPRLMEETYSQPKIPQQQQEELTLRSISSLQKQTPMQF